MPRDVARRFSVRHLICLWALLFPAHTFADEPIVVGEPLRPIPEIVAASAMVIDPSTGFAIYEKKADTLRAVASTQKLLTALIVVENGELEKEVRVERTDTKVEPTRIGIRANAKYSRQELVTALLVKSGNDVARCLARDQAGGQEAFTEMLNAKARVLGMRNSHFINPHGLTVEGQYSTARDMAKLAMAAYQNDVIRSIVCTKEFEFHHPGGWAPTFRNTNQLLTRTDFVNGMKTGYTDAAGRCLIASAHYEGRHAIAVVLGSDGKSIWNDAEQLLRWVLGIPEDP